ncbi:ABC transporter ATPase [Mucilaginibacter limnophilus]|uniref:ABC transporter ATPase n=1 Tax=Mucilaginibacter limnophilus TaxID=1932778 RepID=A0A3S2Y269_9SPHI|nr:ABC transporter ATPase [Mucilaginibacter limnophilus]RVU00109.1 ABC transporter ATPase [Mucilaginibacter limnophilus]
MQFSQHSRVWIYQSDRQLTDAETAEIEQYLNAFAIGWTAHNHQLLAKGEVRYNRFLILIIDEAQAGASGCSIDKSVRFMKDLELRYDINLFDRFNLAYRSGDEVLSAPRAEFEELIQQGVITPDTIVFNNLAKDLTELETKWEVPFKQSWHAQLFGSLVG